MTSYRLLVIPAILVTVAVAGCGSSGSIKATTPPITSLAVTTPASKTAVPTSRTATAPSASGTPSTPATPSSAGGQSAVPTEKSPPGDIPDNVAFVAYSSAAGRYSFTHPEGWAETVHGGRVAYTDKLNGVTVEPGAATAALTPTGVTSTDVPQLKRTQAAFELISIKTATVPGGSGVLVVYRRNSAPDAVTGRQYRDEVERYELVKNGREVVMEMYGPVGADNVDAYRTMVQSLRFR